MPLELKINNVVKTVDVDPDTPLLWVLRDTLDLHGTKYGSPDCSHPVQRAWEAIDVPQCGYCQAGQIMTASALLAHTPHPSDQEIDAAMSGNLCRCGTYPRIRQAVRQAASTLAS
jgi:isoquinoline 1-oxidoreductase alpha subunit